ncbi:MAG TPA: rod shape-determining protein RodA [Thermodesulfobacteriota bacterium]|nr:rod shape-determining protein RodA [Thermodesulfobacteriota bacterium]
MFDRRMVVNFDWVTLVTACFIAAIGVANIYSSTYPHTGSGTPLFLKQTYWLFVGFGFLAVTLTLDYRTLVRYAYTFYIVCLILLALVVVVGRSTAGSQRWVQLGFVSFQPSELAKVALVLALTRFFTEKETLHGYTLRDLLVPFLILGLPAFLIFRQPDLGTVLLLFAIFGTVLIFAKVHPRTWMIMGGAVAAAVPVLWHMLKPYQRNRLLTFLNPDLDPLKTGYHINQSKIAVGSGTLWGKGFLHGTQSQLHFLPEQHTDFIFSVLAEEWGFIGCFVLLFLLMLLISRGLKIARTSKDRAGSILAVGITAMLFWQTFINVGMVVGILPVVGVPLPLVSYGGTSLVTTMMGIGILMNISTRRFMLSP